MTDRLACTLNVADLVAANEPFSGFEWDCAKVDIAAVKAAVRMGVREDRSWQSAAYVTPRRKEIAFHVHRIAHLVQNPAGDAILVDIEPWVDDGNPAYPKVVGGYRVRVHDGSHRLAAAFVRGDETIDVLLRMDNEYVPDPIASLEALLGSAPIQGNVLLPR